MGTLNLGTSLLQDTLKAKLGVEILGPRIVIDKSGRAQFYEVGIKHNFGLVYFEGILAFSINPPYCANEHFSVMCRRGGDLTFEFNREYYHPIHKGTGQMAISQRPTADFVIEMVNLYEAVISTQRELGAGSGVPTSGSQLHDLFSSLFTQTT